MTEHPNLASALVAALADLTVVGADRVADAGSYKYKYADLGDIVGKTRPVLAEHGIAALTPVHGYGDGLACTVILLHVSGERETFDPFPFPHGRDAQATGSMVTYHRRYALLAALGMAAGDDDDGASAAARPAAQERPAYPCNKCDFVTNEREAMRDHLVTVHGFIRQDDGSVVAPKSEGSAGDAATEPVEPSELTAPFEYAETKA